MIAPPIPWAPAAREGQLGGQLLGPRTFWTNKPQLEGQLVGVPTSWTGDP